MSWYVEKLSREVEEIALELEAEPVPLLQRAIVAIHWLLILNEVRKITPFVLPTYDNEDDPWKGMH